MKKLTESQKRKVVSYIKSLQSKKLNESKIINAQYGDVFEQVVDELKPALKEYLSSGSKNSMHCIIIPQPGMAFKIKIEYKK